MNKFLKKQFYYFSFFYGYLGNSAWGVLIANMIVAFLDVLGLALFLPILQAADADNQAGMGGNMGNLKFILQGVENIGIPINLINLLLLLALLFIAKGFARYGADFYRVIINQRFTVAVRIRTISLLSMYDYALFSKANSGRIQNTLSGEVTRIVGAFRFYFTMLQHGVMLLIYIAFAYLANPRFAIMVVVGALLSNLIFNRIYRHTKDASNKYTEKMHKFQDYLIQNISNFKYLKATALIITYRDRIKDVIRQIEIQNRKIGKLNALATSLREPIVMVIVVLVILVQVVWYEETIGLIILALLFFYRGLNSLISLQNTYNGFLSNSGSIENMKAFTEELKLGQEANGTNQFTGLNSGIRTTKLSYSFNEGGNVINNLTFHLPQKKTLGVVGGSGAGKTTLINILCGMLTVEKGMLFMGDNDISDLDLISIRSRIGYVTQEAQVFADTVENNVSFWDPDSTPEKVFKALKMAHADQFVRELPNGVETMIGINGINLSGGQRQRIAIARELYRDIDLLILDEATSALDSESENSIQENIETLTGKLTMIVIAHRLATIRSADLIIHLKAKGEYEIGTFDSLVESSEEFKEMVVLQNLA
jgi:subfamily B ATP-binding cassette protein MsbA